MKKLKLYLETSVWNFYFADDAPEKRDVTIKFFEQIAEDHYEIFISDIVLEEIAKASEEHQRRLFNLMQTHRPTELEITDEALSLADQYRAEGVVPQKAVEDAIHAAVATCYAMDALISWNLKHLANFRRMKMING